MDVKDDKLGDYQRRTLELEALYETAGDLSSLHDVGRVLSAIVRRSRQLLTSDVAYLMLLHEERREAYMRVSEGIQTQEFLSIRLAYGEGLGGLVASTGMPQWTRDYWADDRFAPKIGAVVRGEGLQALLGVPLKVGNRVIGVLFASDRHVRDFTHGEVALLSSLANHAAIALDNASSHEDAQKALLKWREASRQLEEQNRTLEHAAELHERLTTLVVSGASLDALAETVTQSIGGETVVLAADGTPLTPHSVSIRLPSPQELDTIDTQALVAPGSIKLDCPDADGPVRQLVVARAGTRKLGYLVHQGAPISSTDVRSLERAALVTALTLLGMHADEEALSRTMAELVTELAIRPDTGEKWARERAEVGHIALPEAPYVALVVLDHAAPGVRGRLEAATRIALTRRGLARAQDGEAALLLHGRDAAATAREVATALSQQLRHPVAVGATGPHESLRQAARALSRARTCARVLAMTGQWGRGSTPEELGVYTLLFSEVGRDQIEEFVTETIGPVLEYDAARGSQLVRTLEAYFDAGGQTGALVQALVIHVNTLYQRLDRLDRLLGRGWRAGDHSLQVHLALRLHRLIRSDG